MVFRGDRARAAILANLIAGAARLSPSMSQTSTRRNDGRREIYNTTICRSIDSTNAITLECIGYSFKVYVFIITSKQGDFVYGMTSTFMSKICQ